MIYVYIVIDIHKCRFEIIKVSGFMWLELWPILCPYSIAGLSWPFCLKSCFFGEKLSLGS